MKTCLVVEDIEVSRKLACSMIEDMGFLFSEAEDGAEALKICKNTMPDIVLLDWNMPVMNGLDFLIALRNLEKGDTPKVVLCTTENNMEGITQALEAGADEYIMKPYDDEIMRHKFEQVGVM